MACGGLKPESVKMLVAIIEIEVIASHIEPEDREEETIRPDGIATPAWALLRSSALPEIEQREGKLRLPTISRLRIGIALPS